MNTQPKQFDDRDALIAHVKNLSPSLADRRHACQPNTRRPQGR